MESPEDQPLQGRVLGPRETQSRDQFVEENDYSSSGTPTPRDKEQTTQLLHMNSDMTRAKDDMDIIRACLETVKTKLEKENTVPENIDTPVGASMDVQSCFQAIVSMCERCHKNGRDIEQLKRKIEAYEAKNKELEKETSEKQEQIDRLTAAIDTLEKKHSEKKEEKLDNMKEQMKMKNLEKQVNLKVAEVVKLQEENNTMKHRLNELMEKKGSEMADMYNTFPPRKIADQFKDLYASLRNDAFQFYISSLNMADQVAAARTMDIVRDAYAFCEEASLYQHGSVICGLVNPCEIFNVHQSGYKVDEVDSKQISNIRKQTSKYSCEHIKNAFVTKLESSQEKYSLEELTGCMAYIERSVELCWYMCLQTPPMHIGFADNDKQDIAVDKTKYEIGSGKGTKVDFVLWPPLYDEKDGNIVMKGVIQTK
ncbi:hypothetical protein DPMN_107348 [Dreissena polymorpha]|uniref:Mitochondria-eating protein C-terminal domain-containing protein n=1 Tax=Dreissena polymorpha TaxID=45954 RepID=A0A9D4QKU8_DREPO|nr:hypothetical protein DPMN_107348 [Dreissena polymorpha]